LKLSTRGWEHEVEELEVGEPEVEELEVGESEVEELEVGNLRLGN
jgi:hypothetical protein